MPVWLQLSGILLLVQSLAGQTALVRSDIIAANTCLGMAEVKSALVEPSGDVVIAVLGDTLRDEEWAQFRLGVASFYQAAKKAKSMRLAVVLGNNVQIVGPFKTRSLLQTALGDLAHATPG